jgi:nucleoside-diphosphate-sugar epimerase
VVCFDIAPKADGSSDNPVIEYVQGDITDAAFVLKICAGVECVFHIAALVGPYHPAEAYTKVNYQGTVNVINACEQLGIKRIVMSSSPSTRFPYPDPNVSVLLLILICWLRLVVGMIVIVVQRMCSRCITIARLSRGDSWRS